MNLKIFKCFGNFLIFILIKRDNVIRSFRLGKTWVLICTELMSRGIDFKYVNLVINYDFPTTAISYIHRFIYNFNIIEISWVFNEYWS